MSIPIGGDHIRSDIATVLHIPFGEAEHLKKRIFTTPPEDLRREGIDADLATQAIVARVEELFGEYVRNALAEATPQHFPGGIILSGGVSDTPGIEMMLEDILQMPVRKAVEPVYKMPPGLDNASYVSAAGILRYQIMTENDPYLFMESDQLLPGLSKDSEKRKRQEEQRGERKKREEQYEPEDDEEVFYGPEDDYGDDDEDYEDDEEAGRENVGEFLRNLKDRFKKLF